MKCSNCNALIIDEKAKKCPCCGMDLYEEKVCSNCGTILKKDAKFCYKCGAKDPTIVKQIETTTPTTFNTVNNTDQNEVVTSIVSDIKVKETPPSNLKLTGEIVDISYKEGKLEIELKL